MSNVLAALVLVLIVVGVAALLEHTHRRTAGLPRAPFGADLEGDADIARVLHDLAARRG